jgi:hypothetical protein
MVMLGLRCKCGCVLLHTGCMDIAEAKAAYFFDLGSHCMSVQSASTSRVLSCLLWLVSLVSCLAEVAKEIDVAGV